MTTYADLKTDIANESIRPNLTAQISRFIKQATQRINREVRVSDMERRARAFGNGTTYLTSPLGFLEMRRLWNVSTTNQRNALTQLAPQALRQEQAGGKVPNYFAVGRGQPPELEFEVPLGTDNELEMIYVKEYADFEDDTDTNWLLDNAFDLYFEGSLYYLYKHDRNNEEAASRAAGYKAALGEIDSSERRKLYTQPIFATANHNVV